MRFANKLPMAFAGVRDEVVDNVTNIALRFQHKATWHYLHLLCEDLKTLECNQELRDEVNRLSNHFEHNSNIVSGSNRNQKSSSPSTGRYILWGIWILLGILRAGSGCNDQKTTSDFDYTPVQYENFPANLKDSETIYEGDTTGLNTPAFKIEKEAAKATLDSLKNGKLK
jgi:hypothetical protein